MTERLYYDDASLWKFEAKVTSVKNGKRPGEWEVTLDRSAFYPTSGGQPFDTGTLSFGKAKAKVTNVEADASGEVIHTVDREIPAGGTDPPDRGGNPAAGKHRERADPHGRADPLLVPGRGGTEAAAAAQGTDGDRACKNSGHGRL